MAQVPYDKTVEVNRRDIRKAIELGVGPMTCFYDEAHEGLPFFGNLVTEPGFGNSHHPSFSMSHIPGRWLNALLNAEDVTSIPADEQAIERLRKWAYRSLESVNIGFPACIDVATACIVPETDLHNLREVMHALYALCAFRGDQHARTLALGLIDTVDLYFDYERCAFRQRAYEADTGAHVHQWVDAPGKLSPFPVTFGRYIGPLVKLYRATGETRALEQAMALKEACFRHVLDGEGNYDVETFGEHTHSTTAMISSLAQLGAVAGDQSILRRVDAFVRNGLRQIAIDTGWCVENYYRQDDVGEINNTSDIMETCLILGAAGYAGYYARAERILRAAFLPTQLLDTRFIPRQDEDRMFIDAVGAFGFPCPYGHEYQEGAPISFNWDIVGGGVGGLCEAQRALCSQQGGLHSVNLLFDVETDALRFTSPYGAQDTATLQAKIDGLIARVRVPTRCTSITCPQAVVRQAGEWLYLPALHTGESVSLRFELNDETRSEYFRGRAYTYRWHGEEVTGMHSAGKRLCFFPEID